MKIINSELKKNEIGVLHWLKAQILVQLKDISGAAISFEKSAELDSKNDFAVSYAGHFFGETMLDYEKSFGYFEKVFQMNPADSGHAVNYAESLITVKRYQEGYNLADRIYNEERDIFKVLAANFIKVHSLFFLGKTDIAINELNKFIRFYSLVPPSTRNTLIIWSFNKLRKFIQEQISDPNVSQILVDTICLLKQEMSIDDYMEKLEEFMSNYSVEV